MGVPATSQQVLEKEKEKAENKRFGLTLISHFGHPLETVHQDLYHFLFQSVFSQALLEKAISKVRVTGEGTCRELVWDRGSQVSDISVSWVRPRFFGSITWERKQCPIGGRSTGGTEKVIDHKTSEEGCRESSILQRASVEYKDAESGMRMMMKNVGTGTDRYSHVTLKRYLLYDVTWVGCTAVLLLLKIVVTNSCQFYHQTLSDEKKTYFSRSPSDFMPGPLDFWSSPGLVQLLCIHLGQIKTLFL